MRRLLFFFVTLGACLSLATPAFADPPSAAWEPAWSHATTWDYGLAVAGAGFDAFSLFVLQPIRPPDHWDGPILFDSAVRNALRAPNENDRETIEYVAWGIWGAQLAYPVVVDVPYAWRRYGYGAARDLFWQDAVTLTLAGAVDGALRDLAGRTRPDVYDCISQHRGDCLHGEDSTRSFPGGHVTNSAAAAALVCTQHLDGHLYGSPFDGFVCATTITASASVAVMRIISDNHWATDEIVGAALGTLIGWGVPYVMHYRRVGGSSGDERDRSMIAPMPMTFQHGLGMGVVAIF